MGDLFSPRTKGLARSAPCSPQHRAASRSQVRALSMSEMLLPDSYGRSLPSSPVSSHVHKVLGPSPLMLCRHSNLSRPVVSGASVGSDRSELWLLQPQEERRFGDPARRVVCRWLSDHPEDLLGKAMLEV